MNADTFSSGVANAAQQQTVEVADWIKRRQAARECVTRIATYKATAADIAALTEFAADEKWEVRYEAAWALEHVEQSAYRELRARLSDDTAFHVRSAARQAIKARAKHLQRVKHQSREADVAEQLLANVQKRYGVAAAKLARRACQRHRDLIVGSILHDLNSLATGLVASTDRLIREGNVNRTAAVRTRDVMSLFIRMLEDMRFFIHELPGERRLERLREVVEESVEIATTNVRERGVDLTRIKIQVAVPTDIILLLSRPAFVMALANLIQNALESVAIVPQELRTGRVAIHAETSGDELNIVIQDNGLGMSDAELTIIRRLIPGRRNKAKRMSTGYGLCIAVRNIEAHQGTVRIASQEDVSTCVTITMPNLDLEISK